MKKRNYNGSMEHCIAGKKMEGMEKYEMHILGISKTKGISKNVNENCWRKEKREIGEYRKIAWKKQFGRLWKEKLVKFC